MRTSSLRRAAGPALVQLLLLAAAAGPVGAQTAPPPAAATTTLPGGSEVRLFTRSGVIWRGVVRHGEPGRLTLAVQRAQGARSEGDSTRAFPLDSLHRLERRLTENERRRRFRLSLGVGILAGFVGGALVGAAMPAEEPACELGAGMCFDFSGLDRAANVTGGFLIGGAVGALFGAMHGQSAANAWREVPLPVRVAVVPGGRGARGGARLSVAVAGPLR